jgi:hypothetical protein
VPVPEQENRTAVTFGMPAVRAAGGGATLVGSQPLAPSIPSSRQSSHVIMCNGPRAPDRPKWAGFLQLECCSLSNIRPRWGLGGSVPQGRLENLRLGQVFKSRVRLLLLADDQNADQVKLPAGCVLQVARKQSVGPD